MEHFTRRYIGPVLVFKERKCKLDFRVVRVTGLPPLPIGGGHSLNIHVYHK